MKSSRLKNNRLFFKIYFYFLLLLIPILIIGMATYFYTIYATKKNFEERISTNLGSSVKAVDAFIRMAQETGVSFFDEEEVQQLLLPDYAQTINMKVNLWKIPKIIQKEESIIGNISDSMFAYTDTQSVYTNNGIDSYDNFFNKFYIYKKYDFNYWNDQLNSGKTLAILAPSEVEKIDDPYSYKVVPIVMTKQTNGSNIVLVQNLSVNTVVQSLKGDSIFQSTIYLVIDQQGNIICNDSEFNSVINNKFVLKSIETSNEIRIDGVDYIVNSSESELCGWLYYSLTPIEEFNGQADNILFLIMLLSLILIVMGIVISYIFSLNIYSPIRNIRDIIIKENSKLSYNKKADEIQIIQKGISLLSSTRKQSQTILNTYSQNFIENSFLFLFEGRAVDLNVLTKMLTDYAGFDKKGYICCILYINFNSNYYHDFNQIEHQEILHEIFKISQSCMKNNIKSFMAQINCHFLCLCNINGADDKKILFENLNKFMDLFKYDIYYCGITISISESFFDIGKIGDAFDDAMTSLMNQCSKNHFDIICSNGNFKTRSFSYSTSEEQKILNCLSASDCENLRDILQTIWDNNISLKVSYRQMNQLLQEIHYTGVRFLEENGIPSEQIRIKNKEELQFSEFEVCADSGQFIDSLIVFFHSVIEITGNRPKSKTKGLVSLIIEYIHANYDKDLSLNRISDEMNVSVKYVSRIFKEKMGINLTLFITQVRVEKSEELLKNTDLTVCEIANRVGIYSRTTFLRIFKKIVGITPNEYRIANKKKS